MTRSLTELPQVVLPDVTTAAGAILAQTLKVCANEMALEPQAVIERLAQRDQSLQALWYCALAEQIAAQLAVYDSGIRAVYMSDQDSPERGCFGSGALLFIWAESKTAALDSLLKAMDQALARQSAEQFGAVRPDLFHVRLVDDADLRNGALVSMLLFPHPSQPVEIWHDKDREC